MKPKLPRGFRVTAGPVKLVDGSLFFEGRVWNRSALIARTDTVHEHRKDACAAAIALAEKISRVHSEPHTIPRNPDGSMELANEENDPMCRFRPPYHPPGELE